MTTESVNILKLRLLDELRKLSELKQSSHAFDANALDTFAEQSIKSLSLDLAAVLRAEGQRIDIEERKSYYASVLSHEQYKLWEQNVLPHLIQFNATI